jgi:phosphoribosyl 1,2-cyclic phosphodiesterase
MRFASLGSGSAGNALVVEAGSTRVLLDCGLGLRETAARLARLGLAPDQLDGVVVTHEHDDHAGGVARLAARHELPVYLTYGTQRALEASLPAGLDLRLIDSHRRFAVGELWLEPFPVPHDAREPVQFVFSDGDRRLGVLTDVGAATPHIRDRLTRCHALVLECNHDRAMLESGPYPPSLKRRVGGAYGHLANDAAAEILASLDNSLLRHVVAAHLSQKNNTPELARGALAAALNCAPDWIGVADQDTGFGWLSLDGG